MSESSGAEGPQRGRTTAPASTSTSARPSRASVSFAPSDDAQEDNVGSGFPAILGGARGGSAIKNAGKNSDLAEVDIATAELMEDAFGTEDQVDPECWGTLWDADVARRTEKDDQNLQEIVNQLVSRASSLRQDMDSSNAAGGYDETTQRTPFEEVASADNLERMLTKLQNTVDYCAKQGQAAPSISPGGSLFSSLSPLSSRQFAPNGDCRETSTRGDDGDAVQLKSENAVLRDQLLQLHGESTRLQKRCSQYESCMRDTIESLMTNVHRGFPDPRLQGRDVEADKLASPGGADDAAGARRVTTLYPLRSAVTPTTIVTGGTASAATALAVYSTPVGGMGVTSASVRPLPGLAHQVAVPPPPPPPSFPPPLIISRATSSGVLGGSPPACGFASVRTLISSSSLSALPSETMPSQQAHMVWGSVIRRSTGTQVGTQHNAMQVPRVTGTPGAAASAHLQREPIWHFPVDGMSACSMDCSTARSHIDGRTSEYVTPLPTAREVNIGNFVASPTFQYKTIASPVLTAAKVSSYTGGTWINSFSGAPPAIPDSPGVASSARPAVAALRMHPMQLPTRMLSPGLQSCPVRSYLRSAQGSRESSMPPVDVYVMQATQQPRCVSPMYSSRSDMVRSVSSCRMPPSSPPTGGSSTARSFCSGTGPVGGALLDRRTGERRHRSSFLEIDASAATVHALKLDLDTELESLQQRLGAAAGVER